MEKCPHCEKKLDIEPTVYRNVETYGKMAIAATNCCGRGVLVSSTVNFRVAKYHGTETTDDWGRDIDLTPVHKSNDNDVIGETALNLVEQGHYPLVLELIRSQPNPLIAAWLATFLMQNAKSNEFKNWLANATYNGV